MGSPKPERKYHPVIRWLVSAAAIALIAIDGRRTFGMSLPYALIGAVLSLRLAARFAVRLFTGMGRIRISAGNRTVILG